MFFKRENRRLSSDSNPEEPLWLTALAALFMAAMGYIMTVVVFSL